jgi:hypothetical protein
LRAVKQGRHPCNPLGGRRSVERSSHEREQSGIEIAIPDMDFHDIKVVCETPNIAVGEYESTTRSAKTGRTIHQLFVGRFEVESGDIKLLRESINLVQLGLAIYPNGLADYKVTK